MKLNVIIALTMLAGGMSLSAQTVEEARILAEDGSMEEAIAMLRTITAQKPKDAAATKLLGDYCLALGDEALAGRLEAERTAMAQQIAAKEEKLQKEIEEL